ncbi:MAG: alpha/beta fold hydrolase [Acidimicrobiales bacterium]
MGVTPRELVWSRETASLWRYRSDSRRVGPPLVIVHSLVSRSYILDLRPGHSFVGSLCDEGFDVFVLEWGPPDSAESTRTLADYIDADIPDAVAAACNVAPSPDVTLMGYCFGGILALVFAARHPEAPVRNLVTMATAVDFDHVGVIANLLGGHGVDPRTLLDETGNLPAATVARGIRMLRPTAEVAALANLWQNLDDDDRVAGMRAVESWLADQVPFPGALFVECVEMFVHRNALVADTVEVAGEHVSLRTVTCPYLAVVADDDFVVPAPSALPAPGLVGSRDTTLLRLAAGHIAFIAGSRRMGLHLPQITDWLSAHGDEPGGAAAAP